ncbi:MAG TPA: c-type cytochrome [Planctomycetota bacterium]|nr:c-type cytochrome [Planctomycetota bacterium]
MNRSLFAVAAALLLSAGAVAAQDDPADKLQALPDFKVEHVLRADAKIHGSWISMTMDPRGRLLLAGQRGQPVTRLTLKDGAIEKEEILKLPVSEIMGMLFAFDALYVNGGGRDSNGKSAGYGLFRLKDTKGDGEYDSVELLREWPGGQGEHGAHGLVLGPDRKIYTVNGNFTAVPKDILPSSPHRNYADDRILPRAEDGNGFGAGKQPPGGYVVRVDADGRNAEIVASGERNTYDIAFNADGELFGFDSDMEWDWGAPWYRPIRVFHAVSGADHGFREGSAKWPEYYADSLPATVTIGIGCPTGVVFGSGAKFPAKYQKALYILDWSYGRLIAVHLTPQGASYTGTWENFVAPKGLSGNGPKVPLNLTDTVVGPDGALYFTVGGRNTAAHLYRVVYTGKEATAATDLHDKDGAGARAARHAVEAVHATDGSDALGSVLPSLSSPDRFIRYAARIAMERRPVDSWKKTAASDDPHTALTALLALARVGSPNDQTDLYKALARFPAAKLDESLLLDKLRVVEVSVARNGKPTDETVNGLIADLNPLYPSKSLNVNTELCQVLIALEAPDAVAKTIALIEAAPTQEEQLGYVLFLRTVTKGWTPELRKAYFAWWTKDRNKAGHPDSVKKWFAEAGRGYSDGASLANFLGKMHTQARSMLSPEESTALAEVLAAYIPPNQAPKRTVRKRTALVKEWRMDDLVPSLDEVAKNRTFDKGKEVFEAAQCILCHKFGNEGGAVGAELTAASSKYTRRDILESILEPSKVISEQYQNTMILTTSGRILDGRVLEENAERLILQPNPLQPEKIEVKKKDIDKRQPSKVSPMPEKLVNNFTKDEILDLLAFIESGGRKDHAAFASTRRQRDVTDRVASELKGNALKITVGNDLFGDPAEGQVKRLKIDYLDGDEAKSRTADENATIEIKASEGRKLVIRKAVYGVIP